MRRRFDCPTDQCTAGRLQAEHQHVELLVEPDLTAARKARGSQVAGRRLFNEYAGRTEADRV